MMNRRSVMARAAALGAVAALPATTLPAVAQTPRANPMPDDLRRALERDPTAPVLGNPNGNITLTEFFDYNCSFCRRMVPVMQQLISSDPALRVVYREWPVFGPGSDFAARASLASLQQGKYWQFHTALFNARGRADETSVMRTARAVGLDEAKLRTDMQSDAVERHISSSHLLAEHMGLMGTPTFIAGDEAAFGALSLDEMRELVKRARAALGVG
ncbi:DsbA family protein [Paracoccus sp. (in: a-proteobacteria)]|uniref:DsbA family protein n=1 Tax=Paracoccus sp. TaxID=267 RepID=UPI0026E1032F|nr:DsbA family protein [Paracoccus sp. (in: a-proteobacteria)]MDO5647076.1 DsbA family protein [Paracoccus sp. (in: a-proteobacteria)]